MKDTLELSGPEEEVLRRARRELAPSTERRQAVRGALLSAVGLAAAPSWRPAPQTGRERLSDVRATSEGGTPPASLLRAPTSGFHRRPGAERSHPGGPSPDRAGLSSLGIALRGGARFGFEAVVGGVIGGVLIGLGAGYWAFRTDPTTIPPSPVAPSSPAVLHRPPATEGAVQPAPILPATEDVAPRVDDTPLVRGGRQRAPEGTAVVEVEQPLAPLSFYEELAYLRRAQAALRRQESALALGLMQSLDRLSSGGALLSERAMTKVLSLCLLDRQEEALAIARELLVSEGGSLYTERLSRSCAGGAIAGAMRDSEVLDTEVLDSEVLDSVPHSDALISAESPATPEQAPERADSPVPRVSEQSVRPHEGD